MGYPAKVLYLNGYRGFESLPLRQLMEYQDRIYGKIEISEPVIIDIVNSPALQRLKEIDQAGYVEPRFPGTSHSRFEHSLGVFALLQRYNAPLTEQVSGLIHDISHSAFSHCIDYVLEEGCEKEQSHQDNVFEEFIRKTEIPDILKKYDFDLDYILDDKNFPLKETELPDLCADRIDYSLRTAVIYKELDEQGLRYILDNLIAENGNWFFKDFASAKKYADIFLKLNRKYYAGLPSAVMFRTVGDYLRYALQKKYISKNDLYTTDKIVLKKIEKYINKDEILELLHKRMNNEIKAVNDPDNYDTCVYCKSRVVNPLYKHNGGLRRLSDADENWNKILQQELKPKQYFIKFDS